MDWEQYLVSMALTVVLTVVKNGAKKTELKAVMLKLRNAIQTAYAGDPDFQ